MKRGTNEFYISRIKELYNRNEVQFDTILALQDDIAELEHRIKRAIRYINSLDVDLHDPEALYEQEHLLTILKGEE